MRLIALVVRAGAVVALGAFGLSLLVDGAERPVAAPVAVDAVELTPRPPVTRQVPRRPPTPVPITVVATGDIVLGSTPVVPPVDGRGFFADVQTDLAGDVVVGNLEGALARGAVPRCANSIRTCKSFRIPPAFAPSLAQAGFTILGLANDHADDAGAEGLRQTIEALTAAGVGHTGREGQITIQRVATADVAILGFGTTAGAAAVVELAAARRLVRRAARLADLVVVSMHAGAEGADRQHVARGVERYQGENRGDVVRFAHAVVDAGADLVVGHGPRVLRGMEWYRGRLIAYSLGSFTGYRVVQLGGPLSVGGVLRITLGSDGRFESGQLVATRLVGPGRPALDGSGAAHGVVRTLSREDFGARAVEISADGLLTR